jgi:glycosyltransferase involved in cell wall biosynthesis
MPIDAPTVSFRERDLVISPCAEFEMHLSEAAIAADVAIVLDIYDLAAAVHPEGHFGWWKFSLEGSKRVLHGSIAWKQGKLNVQVRGLKQVDAWVNENVRRSDRFLINAVLRENTTNAIVSQDRLPAFVDATALAEYRKGFDRDWSRPRFVRAHFVPRRGETIHIVARDIHARGAVGNLCLDLYRLLKQNGFDATLHADHFDPSLNDIIENKNKLLSRVSPADQVIFFYSTYEPDLAAIRDLSCARKTLYFHGITEPSRLQVFEPEQSVLLDRALADLPKVHGFDQFAANSTFNAEQLRSGAGCRPAPLDIIKVILPKVLPSGAPPARIEFEKALLCVGRLAAHKKVDDFLRLLAAVRAHDQDVRAWIVGISTDAAYRDYLRWVETAELKLPAGAIEWFGSAEQGRLDELYARGGLLVSMSEDEGFCLPVFEAMRSGLPVLAFGLPAVREVLGGTGLYFVDKDFEKLATVSLELLNDRERWSQQSEAQRQRALELARAMDGRAFLDLLAPVASP